VYWEGASLSYSKRNTSLLTSPNFTDDPTPPGGIPNDKDVYYRYHAKAKDSQGLYSVASEDFWFYMGRSTSGSIGSNATWDQNRLITANVTVNNGVTVTINSGITIRNMSGTNITSYGKIIANGTLGSKITFTSTGGQSAGSWGSVVLDGAGTSGSLLKYVDINYGTEVRPNNAPSFSIENCTFNTTVQGVNAWGSTGFIKNCTFNLGSSIYHGILAYNSTIGCESNVLYKSNQRGAAILYSSGSTNYYNYADRNDIYGYDWGLGASYGSTIRTGNFYASYQEINNRIRNCSYGLRVYQSGTINMDGDGFGFNSVHSNTYYNALVHTNSTVNAYLYNYWDWPVPTSKFYAYDNGYIYWDGDPLSWDPWGGGGSVAANSDIPSFAGNSLNTNDLFPEGPTPALVEHGRRLRKQGDLAGAFETFKSAVEQNERTTEALLEISALHDAGLDLEVREFLSSLPADRLPLAAYLGATIDARRGANDKALASLDRIPAGSDHLQAAQLLRFYITLNNLKDFDGAERILASMSFDENDFDFDLAHHNLQTASAIASQPVDSPTENKMSLSNTDAIINYPNPFNPSTEIRYQVSGLARVNIKVFDMLGRMVATLVDDEMPAGHHSAAFDGARLASGLYIARLSITPSDGGNVKPVVQTIKMLLAK